MLVVSYYDYVWTKPINCFLEFGIKVFSAIKDPMINYTSWYTFISGPNEAISIGFITYDPNYSRLYCPREASVDDCLEVSPVTAN